LKSHKVLAIQFKYLGDAVILTPALRAIAMQIPNVELHVLVASEIAPLLENIPWITKVWAMPRQRGKLKLMVTLPFIFALRREEFDQSIDFGGNDRGALLSYLSGAQKRLGPIEYGDPKWTQRICYTEIKSRENPFASYFNLHFELLHALNVTRPNQLKIEIFIDGSEAESAEKVLPNNYIICHISTSQPKKDWPLSHWQTLFYLADEAGIKIIFSAGPNERERNLLSEFKLMLPEAKTLPAITNLKLFLSVIKRSKLFVCGDTGPLHFAEGMGVPVLGIFGVGNSIRQVAPIYSEDEIVRSDVCACDLLSSNADVCLSSESCMASIQPESVFFRLKRSLNFPDSNMKSMTLP